MNGNTRLIRKSYAMQRMGLALARAVSAASSNQKTTAARWAAAWGLLCGIKTPGVYLKRSAREGEDSGGQRVRSSAAISVPPAGPAAPAATDVHKPVVTSGIFKADNPPT
jgi:hypothetical protein